MWHSIELLRHLPVLLHSSIILVKYILHQAGISGGIAIVLLGCSASFLTALSISAISTNGIPKVRI